MLFRSQMSGGEDPTCRKFLGQTTINDVLANPNNYPVFRRLKYLNALRKRSLGLMRGTQNPTKITYTANGISFVREYSGITIVVGTTRSGETFTKSSIPNGTYINISDPSQTTNVTTGSISFTVSAHEVECWQYGASVSGSALTRPTP